MYRRFHPPSLALLALASAPSLAAQTPTKKLIEFGWDRPSPAYMAANVTRMDSRPFDGVVLQFSTGPRVFRLTPVDTVALDRDAHLLRGAQFKRLTSNFALMGLTPDSSWDWFDDRAWTTSESNVWRMARAARAGGLKGIALDYEPYGRNPWDFRKLPHGNGRAFADYAAKVRSRGAQFMTAMQGAFPDIQLLTFFQMSYLDRITAKPTDTQRRGALSRTDYGLLPAFLSGMLEASGGAVRIVDGNERGYWYADTSDFQAGTKAVREGALRLIPDSLQASYQLRVRVGQTVFLDYILGVYVHPGDSIQARIPAANRMRRLQWNLYQALRNSDEYVWLYSQKIDWWKSDSLPSGLIETVAAATRAAKAGAPVGFEFRDLLR